MNDTERIEQLEQVLTSLLVILLKKRLLLKDEMEQMSDADFKFIEKLR